jgi:thiol-disulfide isomerase/thioredoxin
MFWFQNELEAFLKGAGHKLVVVEFSAIWCGACKMIQPVFHVSITSWRRKSQNGVHSKFLKV